MGIPFIKIKNDKSLNLYESIDDLLLYNFDRYIATKDNNWFIIGYTGKEKKIDSELLNKTEDAILEEYYKECKDHNLQKKILVWAKIDYLAAKYNIVLNLVEIFSLGFDLSEEGQEIRYKYIKEFEKYRYKLPLLNSPSGDIEECNKILTELQGIKTQIEILKSTIKEDSRGEKMKLNRQLEIATISIGYKFPLNSKEITVARWLEICKIMEDKAKQN